MDWKKEPIEYVDECGYRGKNGEDWDWTLWVEELNILFIVHPVSKGHAKVKVDPELYGKWSAYMQITSHSQMRIKMSKDLEKKYIDHDFDFYETEEEAKEDVEKVVKEMLKIRIKSIAQKLKEANEKLAGIGQ